MKDRSCSAMQLFGGSLAIGFSALFLSTPGDLTVARSAFIPTIESAAVAAETPSLRAVAFSKGWRFHRHWLNELGTVVFSGSDVPSPGAFKDDGLVMIGSRGFVKFVSRGDPVPGREGQLFVHLGYDSPELSLNDRDEAAFLATFKPCAGRELLRQCDMQPGGSSGLFLYTGGSIQKIVAVGDVSPGDASLVFSSLSYPQLNNRGEVLFSGTLSIPNRPSEPGQLGIFRFRNGGIEKIVAAGDPTPLGGSFKFDMQTPRGYPLWNGILAMDSDGAILFSDRTSIGTDALFRYSDTRRDGATTCGYIHSSWGNNSVGDALLGIYGSSNTCPDSGYYRWDSGGSLEWIPGFVGMATPAGGTFTGINMREQPQLGGSGTILFMSGIQGGSTPGGYFQYQAGSIRKLVASRDPAPVYTGGDFEIVREEKHGDYTVLVPPSTRFSFNEWNMLAFTSEVGGEPRLFGLFLLADGVVSPIALLGYKAPQDIEQTFVSLPSGWSAGDGDFDAEDRILLNNSGEILFRSSLCCGPWDQGLFLASPFRLEIPNSSFEREGEGGYPAGWSTAWNNSGTGQVARYQGGEASSFSGTSVLRLHVSPGGGSIFVLSDPIAVSSEAAFLVSCRLRYNLKAAPDRVYFTTLQYDRQGNELSAEELQGKEGDNLWNWQTKRIHLRTGKNTAFVRIRFGLKSTDAADLDVDAVR